MKLLLFSAAALYFISTIGGSPTSNPSPVPVPFAPVIPTAENNETKIPIIKEPILDGDETVCPSDYVHLKTIHKNFKVVNDVGNRSENKESTNFQRPLIRRRRQQRNEHEHDLNHLATKVPPITIVRQAGSYVRFTIQNSTWYMADEASSVGVEYYLDDGFRLNSPLHIFAVFATDAFGSEHCIMLEDLSSVNGTSNESSSGVLKARCNGIGSFALVRIYARFSNEDNKTRETGVPTCCDDPYADSSVGSSSNVIEYLFKLKCLATCDNPDEYIDGTTKRTVPALAASLPEPSQMPSPVPSLELSRTPLKPSPSTGLDFKFRKQPTAQKRSHRVQMLHAEHVVVPIRHARGWLTVWNFPGWMDAFARQMNVMHAIPGTGEFHDALVSAWPTERGWPFRTWPDVAFPILGLGPDEVIVLVLVLMPVLLMPMICL